MKERKTKNHKVLCILCLLSLLLSACTPAAYDGGYTEPEVVEKSEIDVINVREFQEIKTAEHYLNGADVTPVKEDGTPYKIAWLNCDETDEQMAYLTNCMKAYAKELGLEIICFDAQGDPQKQIDQVNQSIIQKCDAIIIAPLDASALNISMMKAKKEGIVVINSMMIVDGEEYYESYVGPSDTMVGQQAASMIIEALPEGGEVALIEGAMGSAAQVNRYTGFTGVLEKHPEYKLVEKQTANWTTVEAMNIMESYLAKYPDLKAVYCENDAEALGAVQAIQNAGRDDVIVIGADGMQTVVNSIGAGNGVYGTSLTPIELIGEVQILASLAWLNGDGEKLEKQIITDNVCVIQENAASIKSGWGGE